MKFDRSETRHSSPRCSVSFPLLQEEGPRKVQNGLGTPLFQFLHLPRTPRASSEFTPFSPRKTPRFYTPLGPRPILYNSLLSVTSLPRVPFPRGIARAGLLSSRPTPFYKYITRPSGPKATLSHTWVLGQYSGCHICLSTSNARGHLVRFTRQPQVGTYFTAYQQTIRVR